MDQKLTRDQYLKNIWIRYPAMPKDFSVWGRVQSCDSTQLVLNDRTYLLDEETVKDSSSPAPILVVGDIVALLLGGRENSMVKKIQLLAPILDEPLDEHQQNHDQLKSKILGFDESWRNPKFLNFLEQTKTFFRNEGFLEVLTPTFVKCPGTEPSLRAFSIEIQKGRTVEKFFLPTSPELSLKKVMAEQLRPVFEIKKVFRNEEWTPHHRPEFTMLEWYRPFASHLAIQNDVVQLIQKLAGRSIPFQSCTLAELFWTYLKIRLQPDWGFSEYASICEKLDLKVPEGADLSDLFFLIFISKIEEKMLRDFHSEILFLTDYPPFLAAYSKINECGWADRFEVYWQGMEIGNAFHEINDPDLQKKAFERDQKLQENAGLTPVPQDLELIEVFRRGAPPAGGIAIGCERLASALIYSNLL